MARLCLNSALICASLCLSIAADTTLAAARMDSPRQPLAFEVNQGQTAPEVAYLTRGPGYMLYLTRDDAVLSLNSDAAGGPAGRVLTMHLVGAAPRPRIDGASPLAGKHNYYIGDNPAHWHTGIPTYGAVDYTGIYPGIDMVYHGQQGLLEYDFHIAPGANPNDVRLSFSGADHMKVNGHGDLLIDVGGRQVVHHAPYAYQTVGDAKRPVDARYVIRNGTVAFQVGDYDSSRPLVIDPALNYSSYLGGLGDDKAYAVAVDASGNKYLTGVTNSTSLPKAIRGPYGGATDAFVTKLDSAGGVVFTTYLGNTGTTEPPGGEKGDAIAVGSQGKIYVTGGTAGNSGLTPFPYTPNAYHICSGVSGEVFVTILNTNGTISYSTCLGGGIASEGLGIALDSNNVIYVVGYTTSASFPYTNGALKTAPGTGGSDFYNGFFFKLDITKSVQLIYSTYVGGDGIDKAYGIALDSSNNAYITGSTTSSDNFPITPGAYQTSKVGPDNITGQDAFMVKITPDPTKLKPIDLKYGTYFGGGDTGTGIGTEAGTGIAVSADGSKVYIVGSTTTTQSDPKPFPLKLFYQNVNNGGTNGQDAFAAGINPVKSGASDLIFSTYLGGTEDDSANAVAVDANARVYVVGTTSSADMFSSVLTGTGYGGGKDAFVAVLDNTYTTLHYAAYLGGGGDDEGRGIALDGIANAYIVGDTASTDFPLTTNAEQKSNAGGQDAFLSVIGTEADVGITSFTGTSPAPALLQPLTYTVNITNFGPDTATGATLTVNLSTAGLNDPSNPPTFNNPNCQSTNSDFSSFSCSLGTLTSNQLVTITITGTLTTAASMTATATVTADQLDTNSGNNSLAWEVTAGTSSQPVTPPTTVGGGGSSSGGGSLNPGALAMLGLLALYACITGQRRHPRGGVARSIPAITRPGRRAATTQR